MSTKLERARGTLSTGEMNGRAFAEHIGVAHGTVKRWLHEGLPARRDVPGERGVWIDAGTAKAWIASRFQGRKTIAFDRRSFVYLAQREDGLVKIGWSSDVMRRMFELRKATRQAVQLLACFPGDKPDELLLHDRFSPFSAGGEWYEPADVLMTYVDTLRGRAA